MPTLPPPIPRPLGSPPGNPDLGRTATPPGRSVFPARHGATQSHGRRPGIGPQEEETTLRRRRPEDRQGAGLIKETWQRFPKTGGGSLRRGHRSSRAGTAAAREAARWPVAAHRGDGAHPCPRPIRHPMSPHPIRRPCRSARSMPTRRNALTRNGNRTEPGPYFATTHVWLKHGASIPAKHVPTRPARATRAKRVPTWAAHAKGAKPHSRPRNHTLGLAGSLVAPEKASYHTRAYP